MKKILSLAMLLGLLSCGCNSIFDCSPQAMGGRYVERGNTDKGISYLDKAIKEEPSAYAYQYRAVAYMKKHDYPKALADAKSSLALEDNARIHYLLGVIYETMDERHLAVEEFAKAAALEPKEPIFQLAQAETYFNLGDAEKAREANRKATELDGDDLRMKALDAKINYYSGDFKKGMDALEQILKENPAPESAKPTFLQQMHDRWFKPRNWRWLALGVENELAWELATCPKVELRNPIKALTLAKQAKSLSPCAKNCDILAAAYAANGDFENAKTEEGKALELLHKEVGDGCKAYAGRLAERLELYKQGKAYSDTLQASH